MSFLKEYMGWFGFGYQGMSDSGITKVVDGIKS